MEFCSFTNQIITLNLLGVNFFSIFHMNIDNFRGEEEETCNNQVKWNHETNIQNEYPTFVGWLNAIRLQLNLN